MYIIVAILVFCVIIIVHELGHFAVAKLCGMKVYEFSIGMGPRLLKKRGKETLYSIKLLPIGGSVQLGEDEEDDDPRSFRNKPVWQRMLVIVAGAFMNLVLGVIVCICSNAAQSSLLIPTVGNFKDGAVTSQSLQYGDEILEINGMSIWTTMDISYQLQNTQAKMSEDSKTASFDFIVRRNGEVLKLDDVTFAFRNDMNGKGIVVDFYVLTAEKNLGNVLSMAFRTAATEGRLIWITFIDLVTGTYGINDLAGPVGVVDSIQKVATLGLDKLLTMIAFITINVGIFNLLPIPALDGARFVFLLIEAIRRKPIKAEHEGIVHFVGLALMMLLMVVVTFNDIRRVFFGG